MALVFHSPPRRGNLPLEPAIYAYKQRFRWACRVHLAGAGQHEAMSMRCARLLESFEIAWRR